MENTTTLSTTFSIIHTQLYKKASYKWWNFEGAEGCLSRCMAIKVHGVRF